MNPSQDPTTPQIPPTPSQEATQATNQQPINASPAAIPMIGSMPEQPKKRKLKILFIAIGAIVGILVILSVIGAIVGDKNGTITQNDINNSLASDQKKRDSFETVSNVYTLADAGAYSKNLVTKLSFADSQFDNIYDEASDGFKATITKSDFKINLGITGKVYGNMPSEPDVTILDQKIGSATDGKEYAITTLHATESANTPADEKFEKEMYFKITLEYTSEPAWRLYTIEVDSKQIAL